MTIPVYQHRLSLSKPALALSLPQRSHPALTRVQPPLFDRWRPRLDLFHLCAFMKSILLCAVLTLVVVGASTAKAASRLALQISLTLASTPSNHFSDATRFNLILSRPIVEFRALGVQSDEGAAAKRMNYSVHFLFLSFTICLPLCNSFSYVCVIGDWDAEQGRAAPRPASLIHIAALSIFRPLISVRLLFHHLFDQCGFYFILGC